MGGRNDGRCRERAIDKREEMVARETHYGRALPVNILRYTSLSPPPPHASTLAGRRGVSLPKIRENIRGALNHPSDEINAGLQHKIEHTEDKREEQEDGRREMRTGR